MNSEDRARPSSPTVRGWRIIIPSPVEWPTGKHIYPQKAKDRDCFQFTAQKDQRLVFHGKTRSLGSPCDLYLRLETADGQKLAQVVQRFESEQLRRVGAVGE